jgi:hypothetical protein
MNAFLAQLDRRLDQRGELVDLRRISGTTNQTYVQCRIPAIIQPLTVEQLIGGITQQNFFIIISPTHILRQQWPGGYTPPATGGTIVSFIDPRLPKVNDKIYVRTAQKNVDQVAPIFDRGQCIRIELKVIG